MKISFKNKKFDVEVKRLSPFGHGLGLMFRTRNCDNLLFERKGKWGIHSWFVFFPFLALWLDEKNKVMEWKIVKPFSFYAEPRREFAKLVEIPLNARNKKTVNIFKNG
jgi:uncharacterized membrane protein (UPF0127 family)